MMEKGKEKGKRGKKKHSGFGFAWRKPTQREGERKGFLCSE